MYEAATDPSPGPRRRHGDFNDPKLAHAYSKDPLLNRKAHGSVSSFHHGVSSSKLASMSNPSLESQLARDFAAQAKVASGSTSSLGQLPNASGIFGQGAGQGSAPTSPYGHPKGVAVAHGVGMGRSPGHVGHNGQGVVLPSIRNWEDGNGHGSGHGQQGINPMFRVVSPARTRTTSYAHDSPAKVTRTFTAELPSHPSLTSPASPTHITIRDDPTRIMCRLS